MASSELYRSVVESSAEGLWVLDDRGRTVFANQRLAEMLLVSREELAGRDHADFLDEVGRVQWREQLARIVAEGVQPTPVDCRLVRSDGVPVWFLVTQTRLRGEHGGPTGILFSLSDIDDRRRLEAALDSSRRELLDAQRIARLGGWSWDAATDVVSVAPGLQHLLGAELEGFPLPRVQALASFAPEQRERLESLMAPLHAGAEESATFDLQTAGRPNARWVRVRAVVHRDESGRVVGTSGTVQDVTESRLAEDALRDMVHQNQLMQRIAVAANGSRTLQDAMVHTAQLVLEHDDWVRARAYVPDPEAPDGLQAWATLGRPDEYTTDDLLRREAAAARGALRSGASAWDDEVRLSLATPVTSAGEVVAVILISSDPPLYRHDVIVSMVEQVAVQLSTVAEREATARELGATRDRAMEASRLKSEFLATMSHEIRTPLNGVIGLNDLIRDTELDAHQQQLADGVAASGRALLGLVDDILDFSKIEAGHLVLETIDLRVRDVLDDVAAMTAEAAGHRGVQLVMHCDSDVPAYLRGDRVRLTQVVSNLVSNAVKFTEDGSVVVRVCVDRSASGTGTGPGERVLRVEVADTGVGIEPERARGIFEPFVQADASTTRRFGGTGLGLAIVSEIVTALDGEVGVESEPGRGSTFWFTVRLAEAERADEPERGLAGRRALVVDPDPVRRAADAETLRHWGMTVVEADPGGVGSDPGLTATADVVLESRVPGVEPIAETPTPVVQLIAGLEAAGRPSDCCLERPVTGDRLREALLAALRPGDGTGAAPGRPGAASKLARGREVPATPRGRVLVVEDTPVNRLVAEGVLTSLGYTSAAAEDGLRALEVLESDADGFDLVLMDVQMPRMDGYAASREIRARRLSTGDGRRLPVVAMTAAAVTGERERCLAAGMDDFLTKPVSPARLAEVLVAQVGERGPTTGPTPGVISSQTTDQATDQSVGAAERRRVPGNETPQPAPTAPAATVVPEPFRPHLDIERLDLLRDMDPGNTSYLDRVIGNFVTRTPGLADLVRQAVRSQDAPAVMASAHRLRGSALNLGVPQAAEAAGALEDLGESGLLDGAEELLERLEASLEAGRRSVLAYQATYTGS